MGQARPATDPGGPLARYLKAAGVPVPDTPAGALRAWVDWLMAHTGRSTSHEARRLTSLWQARVRMMRSAARYPHADERAHVRERNLLGLAIGAGGITALARAAQRDRYYYQRILNGQRTMGERAARALEAGLGLPAGWLDKEDRSLNQAMRSGAGIVGHAQGKRKNDGK